MHYLHIVKIHIICGSRKSGSFDFIFFFLIAFFMKIIVYFAHE